LNAKAGEPQKHWVGNANVAAARNFLEQAQFSVVAENVGGTRGCKIIFNTQTGEVLHRHLTHDATTA
jgi:chemotaxis receptor (MCP) glutamine deamidase CheD